MAEASIVSSNSHITYIARVADASLRDGSIGFGSFVRIEQSGSEYVGIVCDSRLVNPEYSHQSTRASGTPALGSLSETLIDQQKTLIGIIVLGWVDGNGDVFQRVPSEILQINRPVEKLDIAGIERFHKNGTELEVHYFAGLMANSGPLAVPLMSAIIDQLESIGTDGDKRQLALLRNSLQWKQAMGDIRF